MAAENTQIAVLDVSALFEYPALLRSTSIYDKRDRERREKEKKKDTHFADPAS